VKIGRTHLEDAVPLTVGDEWSGWASQLRDATENARRSMTGLYRLAAGGVGQNGGSCNSTATIAHAGAKRNVAGTWNSDVTGVSGTPRAPTSFTCAVGTATLPALAADATLLACPSLAAAADADACVVTPPGACIIHAGIEPACPAGLDARHVLTAASDVGDTCASRRSRARARAPARRRAAPPSSRSIPTMRVRPALAPPSSTGPARPSSARISRSAPTIPRLRRAGRGHAPRPPRRGPWVQR
jgi:hypothetical protein